MAIKRLLNRAGNICICTAAAEAFVTSVNTLRPKLCQKSKLCVDLEPRKKVNSAHPAKSQWVELCSQFTVVKAGRDDRKTKTVTQTQIVTDFLSLGVKKSSDLCEIEL